MFIKEVLEHYKNNPYSHKSLSEALFCFLYSFFFRLDVCNTNYSTQNIIIITYTN